MNPIRFSYIITMAILISLVFLFGFRMESPEEFESGTIDIGVVVSDLQHSIDFYTNILGMTQTGEFSLNEGFGKNSGLTGGIPVDIKVLKLKEGGQTTQWKLMSFNKKANHPRPTHIQDDTGVQYITISVSSLTPFLERIKTNDIKLLGNTPIPLGADRQFALIQDPDGTFIELIGPK